MLTKKQKIICEYLSRNETINFATVRELIDTHYCNGGKHCSDSMSRMVKQGYVIRIKPGVFALNKRYNGNKPLIEVKNQIKLL